MDIPIATLCDAATDYGGKLNLLGAFDTVLTSKFPAVHPQCALALRFAFNKAEEGRKQLRLVFVNEDGKPMMPAIDLAIEVHVPEPANYLSRNLIVNIQQLKFEAPGQHAFELTMNGEEIASIPLLVHQVSPENRGNQPGGGPAAA